MLLTMKALFFYTLYMLESQNPLNNYI